jgi:hypothetical protein
MTDFDIALIGSGPASIAALQALKHIERVAVITGAVPSQLPSARLHPKIRAVSVAREEAPGVAEPLPPVQNGALPLFSTAAAGGLANYWGQQFVRYAANDPWPSDIFEDHADYQDGCGTIEQLFHIEGGEPVSLPPGRNEYVRTPRLLTGSRSDPGAGLYAMRQAGDLLRMRTGATAFETRASALSEMNGRWHILLENGEQISARRIVLAAGVIGNAQLLLRSFPDLIAARFRDHSPWMLYTLGLRGIMAARPASAPRHFNALTLEQHGNAGSSAFASVYDMRWAGLNLLLASTVGLVPRSFRGWPSPPGAGFVKPVQVWTAQAEDEIEINARTNRVRVCTAGNADPDADPGLSGMIDMLRSFDGRVIKASRTTPGFGFHYHDLLVQPDGGRASPVADFLRTRTGDAITCIDASTMRTIGLRPPTLTAMATAYRRVERLMSPAQERGRHKQSALA